MSNIKNYRNKELIWYIIAQILLIITFQTQDIIYIEFDKWQKLMVTIASSTIISSLIGVFSFIFDSMFDDQLKYKCLYLGMRRPGERIFEDIKNNNKDIRYTKENAMKVYSEIYEHMPSEADKKRTYQNSQWYKIYHRHTTVPMISNSHKDYLLCRDIYIATVVVLIMYIVLYFLLKNITFSWQLIVFESILLIATNIAARQRARRFVANVIAHDIHSDSQNKTFYSI